MAKNDINIHVRTRGTRQTKRKLDKVAKSSRKVGDETASGQKQAAAALDKTTQSLSRMDRIMSRVKRLALGFFGGAAAIRAVTAAIQAQNRALEEHAEIAIKQQNKLLRLQYLDDLFKERPALHKEVAQLAEFGRRPFEEVADAWYNLRSKGAGLTDLQQQNILREALEFGRTDPSSPLNTLVDMFALYAKQTGERDANRIQNVIRQTVTEAGGSTAQVAQYMPRFLPLGLLGGLTGPQTAGLWSYITTQLAEPSVATSGLQATFLGLQGKGQPEGQKLLRKWGIGADMDFFTKIQALSQRQKAGQLTLADAELIAGREGAPVFLSLLRDPAAMMSTVGKVVGAGMADRDLTRESISQLMRQDEIARLEEDVRLLDIQIQNAKAKDKNALRWKAHLKHYELSLRKAGWPEWMIKASLASERSISWIGVKLQEDEVISGPSKIWGLPANRLPVPSWSTDEISPEPNNVIINNNFSNDIIYNHSQLEPPDKYRHTQDD